MSPEREHVPQSALVPAKRLKIFITEADSHRHDPLHQTILHLLHDAGVAGATVFKGTAGFGESGAMHAAGIEVMSCNLPLTIEATDSAGKIEAVLPRIAELVSTGLIEVSDTWILPKTNVEGPRPSPRGDR